MFGIHDYGVFLLASFALHGVPGQDVLFVVAQSLSGGRRAGIIAAVGIGTGSLVHTAVVALGLGAVLASFPAVLHGIRLAGAVYLVFLALAWLLRAFRPASGPSGTRAVPGHVSLRQGFVTNVSNAKVLLFYLAFLPQFVTPDRADASLGLLLLGLSFATTGTLWNCAVAAGASALEPFLLRNRNGRRLLDACAGFLLLALAIPILWCDSRDRGALVNGARRLQPNFEVEDASLCRTKYYFDRSRPGGATEVRRRGLVRTRRTS